MRRHGDCPYRSGYPKSDLKPWFAGLALALALCPSPASAAERGVVLNNGAEVELGYCEGTVSGSTETTTTLAIDACGDGGVAGLAPGQSHAFPKAEVYAAKQGLALAVARRQFFSSPRIATILHARYLPTAADDFSALTTLADKGDLPDWRAFIGLLQPMTALAKGMHAKHISAFSADDFKQAMAAYNRYAVEEGAAIKAYAAAVARQPIAGRRRVPGLGAGILVQLASRDYDLPISTAMPDTWLKLQLLAAHTASAMLKSYRQALAPLGLDPFFVTEMQRLERSDAQIRQQAERTYAKAAVQTALGVLTDAEYAKADAAILADIGQALAPYARGRRKALTQAKAALARNRKLIAVAERTVAAMEGRHWQLTITETDGDPPRHYIMVFVRTGAHALEAKIYEQDLQNGNLILVLTWPAYVRANGDVMVNSAVNGLDNAFVIPAADFAHGRFRVRSEGFSEVFIARGVLRRDTRIH